MTDHRDDHDDVQTLLGAYAVDAVSQLERRRVERHLESCDDCAREARLLLESAGELAFLAGEEENAPPDLVERAMSAIPSRPMRRRPRVWLMAAAAAVVVAVIATLGSAYIRGSTSRSELAQLVAGAQREVRFQPVGDFSGRGALYLSGAKAALVLDNIPAAGRARNYQLWSIRGEVPSSMTVIDGHGRVVSIVPWRRGGDGFALTIEPEGGSEQPTTTPVLVSDA